MTAAIRKILNDLATGTGTSFAKVRAHYENLPESQRFEFLKGARDLETKHREYEKNPAAFREAQTPRLFGPDDKEIES